MSLTSEVRGSLARLDSSPAALRRFSRVVGAALLLAGAVLVWRRSGAGPWLAGGGALLLAFGLVAGLVAPAALRPVHRAWMGLSYSLGYCTSRLVLVLLFFLVLTPLALLRRLFVGHALGDTPPTGSAWVKRDKTARGEYERMF